MMGQSLRHVRNLGASYLLFTLVVVVTNRELVGTQEWLTGLLCGFGLGWAWTRSNALRRIVSFSGVAMFVVMLTGLIPTSTSEARSFFQGMSIGMPACMAALLVIEWPRAYAYLRARAVALDDDESVQWLDKRAPK
jgi:hypothetical protein